jgi:hypothetical protein
MVIGGHPNAQISGAALAASDGICLLFGKCTSLEYNCEWVKADPQYLKLSDRIRQTGSAPVFRTS